MARKSKSLTGAFDQFENVEKEEEIKKEEKETTETIDKEDQLDNTSPKTVRDVRNNILSMYDKKSKKKTMEETHTRATFLFRNDLQERLEKLSYDKKRGFKTMFLNAAIEALLDEMEDVENE